MEIETLAYPWKPDTNLLKQEIEYLKQELHYVRSELQNSKNDVSNLKFFCQQLFDRLNLTSYVSNTSSVNKPY